MKKILSMLLVAFCIEATAEAGHDLNKRNNLPPSPTETNAGEMSYLLRFGNTTPELARVRAFCDAGEHVAQELAAAESGDIILKDYRMTEPIGPNVMNFGDPVIELRKRELERDLIKKQTEVQDLELLAMEKEGLANFFFTQAETWQKRPHRGDTAKIRELEMKGRGYLQEMQKVNGQLGKEKLTLDKIQSSLDATGQAAREAELAALAAAVQSAEARDRKVYLATLSCNQIRNTPHIQTYLRQKQFVVDGNYDFRYYGRSKQVITVELPNGQRETLERPDVVGKVDLGELVRIKAGAELPPASALVSGKSYRVVELEYFPMKRNQPYRAGF